MTQLSLVIQPYVKEDTLEAELRSLLRCPERKSATLVFFSDTPPGRNDDHARKNERVMRLLRDFRDARRHEFADVVLLRADRHLGPYRTCRAALDAAFELTDYAVFTEDDMLFATDALRWFSRMYESGVLDADENWAIAGESVFFNARNETPSEEHVAAARSATVTHGYYRKYLPLDFVPGTCFATTRAKWKLFGEMRGREMGDVEVCRLCKEQRKYCIFPVLPRVKDNGSFHPDSHSLAMVGEEQIRARDPKNTYLWSDDLVDEVSSGEPFEPLSENPNRLYRQSVLLKPFQD
jgi:hypothetical protein